MIRMPEEGSFGLTAWFWKLPKMLHVFSSNSRYIYIYMCVCVSQDDFYQHPVELEEVTTNELLGFVVDSNLRTVIYKLPEPWQIRDFASAGSIRLRLSGLQSRCHLISRYSYPSSESPNRIHSLILLYGAKGFSIPDCYRAIRKIQKGL